MRSSCINWADKEPMIIVRKSQIALCDGNRAAAALLSFFTYWHDINLGRQQKALQVNDAAEMHGEPRMQDETLLQYHTIDELVDGLMLFKKYSVRQGLDLLVGKGFISIHDNPNPKLKFIRTKHYQLNVTAVQNALNDISDSAPECKPNELQAPDNHHCLKSDDRESANELSRSEIRQCNDRERTMQCLKSDDVTEITTEITSEIKNTLSHGSVVTDRSQDLKASGGGGEREIIFDETQNPQVTQADPSPKQETTPQATESPQEIKTSGGGVDAVVDPVQAHLEDLKALGEYPHGLIKPCNGEPFVTPGWINPLWHAWVDHKAGLRNYSEIQRWLDCGQLSALVKQGWCQHEVLANSIAKGFDRLIPPCAKGQERKTLEARKKPTQQNKPVGGGNASGVGKNTLEDDRRALHQELKGFTDQLRLVKGSKAEPLVVANIAAVKARIESLGGGACN